MADRTTHSHDTATPALSAETVPSEEFVRKVLETARDYISDAAAGTLTYEDSGEGFKAMAAEDLVRLDAALSASHLAKEGGEGVVVPYDDFHAAYQFVPRSKMSPDHCLKTRLRSLLRDEDLAHADEAEAIAAAPAPNPSPAAKGGEAGTIRLAETALDWSYDSAAFFAVATLPNGEKVPVNSLAEQSRVETVYRAALATPSPQPADTSEADREALELQWGKRTPEGSWVASPQRSVLVRCCAHFEGEIVPVHVKETTDGFTIEPVTLAPQPVDAVREALRTNIEAFLDMHRKGVLVPPTPFIPIELLEKSLAALASDPAPAGEAVEPVADGWRVIAECDREIDTIQQFGSVTLRNSHPAWVRDEDGRTYEAVWTIDDRGRGYWWDIEGESPVDPVDIYPHPLTAARSASREGGE